MAKFKKASDIKVGVVGYGGAFSMGRKHLGEMKAAGMTPIAVCEIDTDRLKIAADEFPGMETYTSLSAMLKKSWAWQKQVIGRRSGVLTPTRMKVLQ